QEIRTGIDSSTKLPAEEKVLSASLTEANMRYSFSLACITFAIVGIPLGITAQRRETSIGFALSLMVAASYIILITFADSIKEKPHAYPHLLMWAPNVIFLTAGGILFHRLSKK
ncbi:MAG TPA: LptF/LptG family permease, partial [Verrucomicrobiaceae bacterium]